MTTGRGGASGPCRQIRLPARCTDPFRRQMNTDQALGDPRGGRKLWYSSPTPATSSIGTTTVLNPLGIRMADRVIVIGRSRRAITQAVSNRNPSARSAKNTVITAGPSDTALTTSSPTNVASPATQARTGPAIQRRE
jgi:hypothetical protein